MSILSQVINLKKIHARIKSMLGSGVHKKGVQKFEFLND